MRKLENASARYHISRLEAVQMQIQQQIELLYGNRLDDLDHLFRDMVSNGYTHGAFELQRGLGVGWDFTALNQKKLEALLSKPWTTDGKTFSDRCWHSKNTLIDAVHRELIQGMLRGDPPSRIVTAIQKQFWTDRYKAHRLVHTETTYFNAVARNQMYQDFDVEWIEIVETLDSRTCSVCQPLDGTVIPASQHEPGVTVPPYHPGCRGTTCPHYDDMEGERAARTADGDVYYVPADMKYEDWKKAFVDGDKGVITKVRNYNSEFGQKFGVEHYDQIRDRVDACSNAKLQKVWNAYECQIKVAEAKHRGGAYCSGNNIFVNIDADAKGREWKPPYATTFHESGHAIDILTAQLGTANGQWHISSTYKDGIFPKTIKEEIDNWIKIILSDMKAHKTDFQYWVDKGWMSQNTADYYITYGGFRVKKSYAYAAVQAEVKSLDQLQYSDISDILEGATHGKIKCGIGHGGSYWTKRTQNGIEWGLATEAFAEMTSATMASQKSLETIKKYLPKSYAVYEEMLELIVSQIGK